MKQVLLFVLLGLSVSAQQEYEEFERLCDHPSPSKRVQAIYKIRGFGDLRSTRKIAQFFADRHPRVRYRAVLALKGLKDQQAIKWLANNALRDRRASIRSGAAWVLGILKDPCAIDGLKRCLRDPQEDVRLQAVCALGLIGDPDSLDAIRRVFLKETSSKVRAFALEAIAKIDPQDKLIQQAITDRAYRVRMVAMESLASLGGKPAESAIQRLIDDPDWRVRAQAVKAALSVRTKACISALIGRLPKEKGRLINDISSAVCKLAGIDIEPEGLKAWWEKNREKVKIAQADVETPPRLRQTGVEFVGVPVVSNRVIFVLDLSGSMRDKVKDEKGRQISRLEIAKRQMIETIQGFDEQDHFNIVLLGCDKFGRYDRRQKTWRRGLTRATARNKREAIAFIRRQRAVGWTNIYDALAQAFEDPLVDTIYLLSDGGASRGIFVSTHDILEHIKRLNRFRNIVIHTIETKATTRDNQRLMRELASVTGGVYKPYSTR